MKANEPLRDSPPSDERREDCRADIPMFVSVDMHMALSYEPADHLDSHGTQWQWDDLAVSPDLVKAMVNQIDLTTQEPLLLQMLTRIDWMLTSVMKTLARDTNIHQALPEFMTANVSGSGIRFMARQEFPIGNSLLLRFVLRPFVPLQAVAKVLRVRSVEHEGEVRYETACEFTEIGPDEREAIIRHVLRSQAVLQRQRHSSQDVFAR